MKTMICATIVALASAASIGLPAAAEDASATASVTGMPFAMLNGIASAPMTFQEMAGIRGAATAYLEYSNITFYISDEGTSADILAHHWTVSFGTRW